MPFLVKLKKRERFILYFTFAVVAFSLIYNFIFEPIAGRYRQINQEIVKSELRLQRYRRLLSQKEKIKKEFDRISEIARTEVSEEEQMALILSEIENLSQRSSVHIIQIRPQAPKDFGTYREFPVEIKAEAKIEDLSQFIYNLQTSPQLLRTKKLRLNTKPTVPGTLEAAILVIKISLP